MTAFALALQATAPPSASNTILQWVAIPALVTVVLGFVVLASYDRFHGRRTKAKDSGIPEAIREAMAAPTQVAATATWMLDVLGKRPEETRGFVKRLLREEMVVLRSAEQSARELTARVGDLAESVKSIRTGQEEQDTALSILPMLQHTFERVERTMEKMQAAMEDMSARMARIEGAAGWDGRERREHGR